MKKHLLLSACLLLLGSCGWFQDSIHIGVVAPLSGQDTLKGQGILNALVLAAEERNQEGGIDGKTVKVLIQDSLMPHEKPFPDNVKAIVHYPQPTWNFRDYPKTPLILIDHAAIPHPHLFQMKGSPTHQANAALTFALANGVERIYLIYESEGKSHAKAMQKTWHKKTGNKPMLHAFEALDLESIRQEEPHLIYLSGSAKAMISLLTQLKEADIHTQVMGTENQLTNTFLRWLGDTPPLPLWMLAEQEHPDQTHFEDRFQKKFGFFTPEAKVAYDAAQILLKGFATKPQNKKKPPLALNQVLIQMPTYRGLSGNIEFDSQGENTAAQFEVKEAPGLQKAQLSEPLFEVSGKRLGEFKASPVKKEEKPKASG